LVGSFSKDGLDCSRTGEKIQCLEFNAKEETGDRNFSSSSQQGFFSG